MRLVTTDGQHAGLSVQRLAKHAAGPARCRGIRFARTDDDGGKPHAAAVEVSFASVIVHQHLAHGFRDAVSGLRELLRRV